MSCIFTTMIEAWIQFISVILHVSSSWAALVAELRRSQHIKDPPPPFHLAPSSSVLITSSGPSLLR